MKHCSTCDTLKPFDNFYTDKKSKDGLRGRCRPCYKENMKKRRWADINKTRAAGRVQTLKGYGIIQEDYDRMLIEQGGVCFICRNTCPQHENLSVDHCHDTGKVRGLLCSNCNRGLGYFKDNRAALERASFYLQTQ